MSEMVFMAGSGIGLVSCRVVAGIVGSTNGGLGTCKVKFFRLVM